VLGVSACSKIMMNRVNLCFPFQHAPLQLGAETEGGGGSRGCFVSSANPTRPLGDEEDEAWNNTTCVMQFDLGMWRAMGGVESDEEEDDNGGGTDEDDGRGGASGSGGGAGGASGSGGGGGGGGREGGRMRKRRRRGSENEEQIYIMPINSDPYTAILEYQDDRSAVGSGTSFLPRHVIPFDSRNEGVQC